MTARLIALLCLAALVAPLTATAQQNPFGPVPPAPAPVTQAPAQTQEDEGLSATQQLLIAGAAILLLGGIALAIFRDARAAAPADRPGDARLTTAEGDRIKGTRAPPQRRVQKGRAKAKAARRARKRNR